MFVFWSRLLVVLLAGTLALALPADPEYYPHGTKSGRTVKEGDLVSMNAEHFVPPGPVSISPNGLLVLD